MRSPLLLLMLVSASFAAQCAQSLFDNVITGEAGINIGIAVSLTILVVGIIYAIGSATNNVNMLVLAKDELYHLMFSAILIVAISGVLFFSCNTLTSFLDFVLGPDGLGLMSPNGCYTGAEAPQAIATCYMKTITKQTDSTVKRMIKEAVGNEMDSTLIFSLYNPITGGVSVPLGAYRKAYAMQFDMIALNFALPALISLNLQTLVLGFSTDLLKWLLPVALLLRVLPFARNMGNMLIAITVGLYVIVPTLYALNGAMDQVVFSDCSMYASVINDQIMGGCDSETSFWKVARAIPQAFFLPNLTLALTITFLGGINKALKVVG